MDESRSLEPTNNRMTRAFRLAGVPAGIALTLAIGVAMTAGISSARTTVAPNNQTPPSISGKAQVGVTLQTDNGTWSGTLPLTYTYQWRICNENGGACHDITGATGNEYTVKAADSGNTLRVQATAKNADGSDTSTSVPTAVVTAAAATTTTSTTPASNGCATNGGTVAITGITPPAHLNIDQFQVSPSPITYGTRSLTARFHVSACGGSVQGALVYVTAVPYGMFAVPNEQTTGTDGWASLDFTARAGFPVSQKQQLLVMFVRARKSGEDILGGISSRRLVSFKVSKG
jgi:hypothetical protein